ncbi:hypothetical protein ACJMQP_05245 [Rhodopseudomonas palustris]
MADAASAPALKGSKDRSPSFPFIPLKTAIDRLEQFEAKFGRHPAPAAKAGLAWGMKEKSSQADQTLAALKSFGLVKYDGMGVSRHASLTDEGRNYLRAQQESSKQAILKVCALRPKIMRTFWAEWGADRPPDEVALDQLILKNGFSEAGGKNFLRVYDETVSFAGLSISDKVQEEEEEEEESSEEIEGGPSASSLKPPKTSPTPSGKVNLMAGERELTTGLLAKDASFRLIVSGNIGVKEIERLIKKLELDKEILADDDGTRPDDEERNPYE